MIEEFKPYPAYKDSGLLWLKVVPEHWNLIPNRALIRKRKILVGDQHTKYQLLSLTKEGVIVRNIESGKGKFSADMGTSQEVRAGDLIFCLFDVPETPRTVGLSHHNGMITGAYTVFECSDPVLSEFFECFYKAVDDRKLLGPLYSGLRNTIPPTRFLGIKTPVPQPEEQTAIVRFLDQMDRRIRRYIRARQLLIKLLEEYKQAIIHRAVTRGLDPSVPLKPSDVEWLGDVPEHWKVVRVKQCAEVISKGTTPSTEGYEISDLGPIRFLKAENISGGKISDRPLCFIDEKTNLALRRSQLRENDVLFVIAGATLGKTAVVNSAILPANTNQAVAFIRPNKQVNSDYLVLWLQSQRIKEITWLNAVQSAQPNLSMTDLGNFMLPLPSTVEQDDILIGLKSILAESNILIENVHHEISLLNEYRTRLISDVVTGKLDVRGLDLPATADSDLPEECSELSDIEAVMGDQELQEELPAESD